MFWPILVDLLGSRCFGHSMYSTIDVVKVDFLVIDVLEVDVLGVRRKINIIIQSNLSTMATLGT
jgi:hypothetical protein